MAKWGEDGRLRNLAGHHPGRHIYGSARSPALTATRYQVVYHARPCHTIALRTILYHNCTHGHKIPPDTTWHLPPDTPPGT